MSGCEWPSSPPSAVTLLNMNKSVVRALPISTTAETINPEANRSKATIWHLKSGIRNKKKPLTLQGKRLYKKVEVRGVEPRSEMVYRSSIYMCSYRIKVHLKRRSVTNNSRLFCLEFTQHLTDGSMLRYPVIVDVATALTGKKPRQR